MTTTPAPTDHDASVPTLAISDLIPVVEAELRAERDAAREELAKTRAELAKAKAEQGRIAQRMAAALEPYVSPSTIRQALADVGANPATTAEPTALPLLPDIAHLTTLLPDDDAPPMAVGIIPNCARCDAPMFVGHRCPAEPADEPKATRCCPRHREPGEARYGCATAPGVTDPCCNDCHYWVAWNRQLDGDDVEPAAS